MADLSDTQTAHKFYCLLMVVAKRTFIRRKDGASITTEREQLSKIVSISFRKRFGTSRPRPDLAIGLSSHSIPPGMCKMNSWTNAQRSWYNNRALGMLVS